MRVPVPRVSVWIGRGECLIRFSCKQQNPAFSDDESAHRGIFMIFAGENLLFLVFEAFHFRQDPKQNLSALLHGGLG